ncbi:hypothetical protein BY458DRAFT_511599 [Sporodiniella umbellata]|nr:hypothetical protein BY458DRAFT_511599 [Sporodiniella umbellata]
MADSNETSSSISSPCTISSANKDLSCLRCRKKKAKCSKTRPTCTRCLRSNQSCEYPDAPPNLSDLSQKVLTLYDSLRELEGEFLVKYMQNMEQEPEPVSEPEEETEIPEEIGIKEVGGWSMSFGPSGLCLQAVTRNWYEYHRFIQSLSRQMARDFGEDCLPAQWDLETDEEEQEELEEDVYLVTVPVLSLQTLLMTKPVQTEQYKTYGIMPVFVAMHKAHMVEHLQQRYQQLEGQQHQLVLIMLYLKPFLESCFSSGTSDGLSDLCIMTAYIGSLCLFPPLPQLSQPPLSDFVWKECISDLSLRLVDVVLGDPKAPVPVLCCLLLLAWYYLEINKTKNDLWIQLALRMVYASSELRGFLPLLAYLDAYSALMQSRRPLFPYRENRWTKSRDVAEEGVLCEAQLMPLLDKVVTLFYQFEGEVAERKIDVDEVLELVKDVGVWENELPLWARWDSVEKTGIGMHMHMVYNIVKILLFRPFTSIDEQTHTKTTFLDMSMVSADRLSVCLGHSPQDTHWTEAGRRLIQDVVNRLKGAFDQDEEIVQQIESILNKA